jgi:uncharacterized protein YfaS (alpha-2-macroglobulin family)
MTARWPAGLRIIALACACVALQATPSGAQTPGASGTAFSLASSHIYSTREKPSVFLTFRGITTLDFRIYRVIDPAKFLTGLRDLHQLGSTEPIVPQDRTWLERLTIWKSERREGVRTFIRGQFSPAYRRIVRERRDREEVSLRRTTGLATFAQVPILNRTQLVTTWREILPRVREAEGRRVPLELPGSGMYVVEGVNGAARAYTVVIVSDLGVVSKSAPGQLLLFAANRFSGEPAPGCGVSVISNRRIIASGETAGDGTYELSLDAPVTDEVVSVVRCGSETAATDPGSWSLRDTPRELVGYIYTDKPVYRPGHTVHVKGVLRWRARGALWPFDRRTVEIAVTDVNEKVVFRAPRTVDEFGAVEGSFALPAGAALGYYGIRISSEDSQASGSFEVQEYVRPEFEVIATPVEPTTLQGGTATVTIQGRYYFGQPVANATVNYSVHRQPFYSPLRWIDGDPEEAAGGGYGGWYGAEQRAQGTTRLDERGTALLTIPLDIDERGQDYSIRLEARVTDAGGREMSGSTIVNATYGRFMVVARVGQYLYAPSTPATLNVRVLDYAGQPQPGVSVNVWLERLVSDPAGGREQSAQKVAESVVTAGADGRASWTTTLPAIGGSYRFRATARSDSRVVRDEAWIWVPGSGETTHGDEILELVADRTRYQPGEIARLLVKGQPFERSVLITKEAQTVSYRRVQRLRPNEAIEVPVGPDDIGDTYVNVVFLGDDRLYRAERRLSVPAIRHQLQLSIVADQALARPGETGTFTLTAQNADGRPARAQVSVGVVDEAVYAIRRDSTADPLRFFYRREYSRVGTQFSREYSFVGYSGRDQLMLAKRRRPFTLADFKSDRPGQPEVRRDFPDAIHWIASLVTDGSGRATVRVRYPDALTTWRLTARAVTADADVGAAVARTTTTKDLIVRVVTPRFLTEGDRAEIPVVVHNYLKSDAPVDVSFSATGASSTPLGDAANDGRRSLTVASGGDERLDWTIAATAPGTATFTGTAAAPGASDAVELSIPILPFGLRRATGLAGSLGTESEGRVSLTIPEASNPAVSARTLVVELSPSLAGSVMGALDFLVGYPYGCTEQIVSSFLPALRADRAFRGLKLQPPERFANLDRMVSDGLRRLYDAQREDGGWGWWRADARHPFMTAYALDALIEARAAGYTVEAWRVMNGVSALEALYTEYPRAVPDLKAYMLYALVRSRAPKEAGSPPAAAAFDLGAALDAVWNVRDRLSPYGQALLLLALDLQADRRADDAARQLLAGVQTRGGLSWWPSARDPLLEDESDAAAEATAFAVRALVRRDPENAVLEQAVRWLLLNRTGSYWFTTKRTAMVIYSLIDYMQARQETAAPLTADLFVNGQAAGSHTFAPADLVRPDPFVLRIPAPAGVSELRIAKRGAGTLYWSASAVYYDTRTPIERTGSRRLAIGRRYFALTPVDQRGRIVYRESPFSGSMAPGDLLLVRLTVAGASDWRYLMVEDPLPAGAEVVQQEELYALERRGDRWMGWSRREFRDDRVVFFQESFGTGRYEYQYLIKATIPGEFKALPAQITPMYVPDAAASSDAVDVRVVAPGVSP